MRFSIARIMIMMAMLAIWLTIGYWSEDFISYVLHVDPQGRSLATFAIGPIVVLLFIVIPFVLVLAAIAAVYGAWLLAGTIEKKLKE